jgi:5-formyltetrahydrofolate cyclo-ligase
MSEESISARKADLRKQVRLRRRQIPISDRAGLNASINKQLPQVINSLSALSISAFWPFDGEPDLRRVIAELHEINIRIALPVVSNQCHEITMVRWHPEAQMLPNRYGIAEPQNETSVAIETLDLMLIPLVAWDSQGRRLGMGAAYYDRILAPLRELKQPYLLGVAYCAQEVEEVPVDDLDIPLHGILNEHGWTEFTT